MKTDIESYLLYIRVKGHRTNLSFADDPDIYSLLKNSFITYIDTQKTGVVEGEENRLMRVPGTTEGVTFWGFDDAKRNAYGIVEAGRYGKQLKITDRNAPRTDVWSSPSKEMAVMKPFFFLIHIPQVGDTAYVVLERDGNDGIKNLFRLLLKSFLFEFYPGGANRTEYSITMTPYLSHDYVEGLLEGTVKSAEFTISRMPTDEADHYMLPALNKDVTLSLVVRFMGGGERPNAAIAQALRDSSNIFSGGNLAELFNNSERKIVTESEINGVKRTRTVYLSDDSRNLIRPYYSVDVEEDERGYPRFDSIKDAVYSYIESNPDLMTLNNEEG